MSKDSTTAFINCNLNVLYYQAKRDSYHIPYFPNEKSCHLDYANVRQLQSDSEMIENEDYSFYAQNNPTYEYDFYSTDKIETDDLENDDCVISEKAYAIAELLMIPEFMTAQKLKNYGKGENLNGINIIPFNDTITQNCYCCRNVPDVLLITCSVCNCQSHLKCYHLNDSKISTRFICIYCQYKIVKLLYNIISEYVENVSDVHQQCLKQLETIVNLADDMTKDMFGNINGERDLRRITKSFSNFNKFCGEAWSCLKTNWDKTQEYLHSFVMDDCKYNVLETDKENSKFYEEEEENEYDYSDHS